MDVEREQIWIAGRYRCLYRLGRGGFSEVFLAEDTKFANRRVAIKRLAVYLEEGDRRLKKFQQEAEIIALLSNPHTVRAYDFGLDSDGRYYIAMEYIKGETLHQVLKKEKRLSIERSVDIALQILEALAEAHEKGIIHRDLKPKNIMLVQQTRGEFVKVLDFGVARIIGDKNREGQGEWTMVGTASYMAPEQAQGKPVSPASDLYSVGIILYQMLSGNLPFVSQEDPVALMLLHSISQPKALNEAYPELNIPIKLDELILKALEKEPENRFQRAEEFIQSLESFIKEYKFSQYSEEKRENPSKPSKEEDDSQKVGFKPVLSALKESFPPEKDSTRKTDSYSELLTLPRSTELGAEANALKEELKNILENREVPEISAEANKNISELETIPREVKPPPFVKDILDSPALENTPSKIDSSEGDLVEKLLELDGGERTLRDSLSTPPANQGGNAGAMGGVDPVEEFLAPDEMDKTAKDRDIPSEEVFFSRSGPVKAGPGGGPIPPSEKGFYPPPPPVLPPGERGGVSGGFPAPSGGANPSIGGGQAQLPQPMGGYPPPPSKVTDMMSSSALGEGYGFGPAAFPSLSIPGIGGKSGAELCRSSIYESFTLDLEEGSYSSIEELEDLRAGNRKRALWFLVGLLFIGGLFWGLVKLSGESEEMKEEKLESRYRQILAEGHKFMAEGKYRQALLNYRQALLLFPQRREVRRALRMAKLNIEAKEYLSEAKRLLRRGKFAAAYYRVNQIDPGTDFGSERLKMLTKIRKLWIKSLKENIKKFKSSGGRKSLYKNCAALKKLAPSEIKKVRICKRVLRE